MTEPNHDLPRDGYIATLIANPQNANLGRDHVQQLASSVASSQVHWLAPQIAVDVYCDRPPDDFEAIWQQFQTQQIDLVVQPAVGRRKSVLLADMDSTMIQQECIDELAAEAGIADQVAQITARAMNGELDFESAIRERVGLLTGLDQGAIGRVLNNRLTYTPGGPQLLATMRANGAYCALVSGGFTDFTAVVAAKLGFDEHRANQLDWQNDRLTGQVVPPILGRAAKRDALKQIAKIRGVGADAVIAVGDGANDLDMLHAAGAGVALHAKPVVAAQVNCRINFGDLTALLYLQGYPHDSFVN